MDSKPTLAGMSSKRSFLLTSFYNYNTISTTMTPLIDVKEEERDEIYLGFDIFTRACLRLTCGLAKSVSAGLVAL